MFDQLSIKKILDTDGLLQQHLADFTPRHVQLDMANAVESAIDKQQAVLVEAATGTGKTFAYLIPALLSGKKIIISTGTKNLQDQLYEKDIPELLKLLKIPVQVALLKGRSNYLCHYRTLLHNDEPGFLSKEIVSQLYRVKLWLNQTKGGDVAELKMIPENAPVWPYVTSSKDNCIGQDCDYYSKCFLVKARQKALKAEIIVINHHLFFADLLLKDTGFGELLPGADAVIFDEAHQLPEIASHFFGNRFSSRQLLELNRDIQSELLKTANAHSEIFSVCDTLQSSILSMRQCLHHGQIKQPWQHVANKPALKQVITVITESLQVLAKKLEVIASSQKAIEVLWQRCEELLVSFTKLTGETPSNKIHWYETFAKSFVMHFTPLNIAEEFNTVLQKSDLAWIFTSATMTTNNQFSFYQKRMGLEDARCLQLDAVFDYQKQAALYLPQGLPEPRAIDYTDRVVEKAIPIINASEGRTFFLFTSHAALQKAARLLEHKIDYPLLIQGSMPKAALVNQFKVLQNAVLLGTSSFWEGVDVKGDALSCVIIDKIPFASPQDPIMQARLQALRKAGLQPFNDYQIPLAVIALKQGIGRLIRDIDDKGLLMLCDPRLQQKNYGKIFLDSLPTMPVLKSVEEAAAFIKELDLVL